MGNCEARQGSYKFSATETDALHPLSYRRILRKHDCSGKDKQARSRSPRRTVDTIRGETCEPAISTGTGDVSAPT
jgi:hypothetical protein